MPDTDELCTYSHVLGLSCLAYLILSGASTFLPAVTMDAVSADLDMSMTMLRCATHIMRRKVPGS